VGGNLALLDGCLFIVQIYTSDLCAALLKQDGDKQNPPKATGFIIFDEIWLY
jgi:hypothetical protein